jgi:serine/threonine-protein kinase
VWDVAESPHGQVNASSAAPAPAPPPRRSPVRLIVAAVCAVWIVIAAVVVLMNLPDRNTRTNVPDLAGSSQDDAASRLRQAKLAVGSIIYEDSTTVSPGMIIRTEPPANRRVAPGTKVTLVLAQQAGNAGTLALPDVTNKTRDDAVAGLTAVGLTAGEVTYEESSTVAEGLVLRTDPVANTQVPPGSTVNLVLAKKRDTQTTNPQPCTVPDVAHRPREYAVSELEKAKVRYEIRREESHTVDAGTVIRTDPGAGRVDPCRTVVVYVSKGAPTHVPGVIGMSESEARDAITAAGLKASVKYDNYCGASETRPTRVTAQSPGGGSTAYPGDTVTITIPKYTGTCPSKST